MLIASLYKYIVCIAHFTYIYICRNVGKCMYNVYIEEILVSSVLLKKNALKVFKTIGVGLDFQTFFVYMLYTLQVAPFIRY